MPKDRLLYLGNCLRNARISCGLTQQELADQSNVAIKTVQMIEKGQMNPSYEILYPLIKRLGISANTLFEPEISDTDEKIQRFIGKFQSCSPQSRQILLNTLNYLAEAAPWLSRAIQKTKILNKTSRVNKFLCPAGFTHFILFYP